jgi:ferricrocin synthase
VNAAEKVGVSPQNIEDMAPCTPLQEGMIARFLESSRGLYCSSFRFELNSDTNLDHLQKAWTETQVGVQLLRVRMAALADGYAQVVLKHDELPWIEMTVANDHEINDIADDKWNAWRNELSNFSCALWRLVVLKSPRRRLLCLNIFHALYDGNSLPLLLEQVASKYHGGDISKNIPEFIEILPHGPLRVSSDAKEFWIEHLVNAPSERLFHEPENTVPETVSLTRVFDQVPDYEHIKATLQVTENAIFHACWLLTLQEYFSLVPTLGIVVSGRALDFPGIESVIGPLFNTIPSYVPLHHLKTKADLVKSCHRYHVSALPFQHTPLRDIMKWARRGTRNPLFEILFVFQKDLKNSHSPPSTNIWTEVGPADAAADFPLSLEVRQSADSVIVTLASQDFAIPVDTANALLSTFERICKDILVDPISALPKLGESSSQTIPNPYTLSQPNRTETENFLGERDWSSVMIEIRKVIADLAGMDVNTVHPGTSIFELGLDSIDAIKLSSRLKSRGIDISVSSIMKQQTIFKMSESLTVSIISSNGTSHVSLARLEEEIKASLEKAGKFPSNAVKILPLTALQESMVAEMIISEYQHYYGIEVFEVMEDTDFQKLLDSWDAVINANPILRTSFVEIEDPKLAISYAQVVHPIRYRHIPEINLQDSSIDYFIQSKISNGICPAFFVYGIRKGGKYYLILSMAHALYDGWSLDLLHADVERAYFGDIVVRPSYEPVLERILDDAGECHRQFWAAALKDFKPRTFPAGQHAGGNQSEVHRTELLFDIPSETIKKFCRESGITVQALSVTTWTLALASFVESLDVGFGLVLSGRSHADADEVMFPTMNTVVLRSILHGSRLEMLKYVQNTLNSLIEHHHYPLRKAGGEVAAGNLFDTLFIYQRRPTHSSSKSPIYKSISGSADTGYPLSVEMELMDESMICRLAARDDLFGMKDAKIILNRVAEVFRLVVSEPQHSTIEFADAGIRICGSPFFQEKRIESQPSPNGEEVPTPEVSTPWTTLESKIRDVLSVVSGIAQEEINKDSTLFHLGLDSISAIKVCSLLRKQEIILPVSSMLKAGSIHKMAAVVELQQKHLHQNGSTKDDASILEELLGGLDTESLLSSNGISAQKVDQILPVTAGQIYCLARNAQDSRLFYASFYYKVEGLNKTQLSEGWKLLAKRLPILRTVFIRTGRRENPWVQVILNHLDNPVNWHETITDIEFLLPAPRSVTTGPVSLHAVETGEELVINLHIHHALYDAISLPRIIDCLGQICTDMNTQLDGNMDFAKFISYQNVHSLSNKREQFWKTYLGGVRPHLLPVMKLDGDDSAQESRHSSYQPGLFENIEGIEAVARRNGLSLQSLFIAVYAKIHSELLIRTHTNGDTGNHHTIEDDFVVGVYLANRGFALEGLQYMISPTLNMVPLRIAGLLSSSYSLIESAHQIQKDLHEISNVDYSGVSLLEINDWTGVRVDAFVNFLKLPDLKSNQEKKANTATSNGIRIQLQAEKIEEITHGQSMEKSVTRGKDGLENPPSKEEEEKQWKAAYMVGLFYIPFFRIQGPEFLTEFLTDLWKLLQNCIDIEAAVRDGKLDVGIFVPELLLSKNKVDTILSRIKRDLEVLLLFT